MSDTAIPDSVMQKAREVLLDADLAFAEEYGEPKSGNERSARIIALAILAAQQEEREACAQLVEALPDRSPVTRRIFATAIRAKGQ